MAKTNNAQWETILQLVGSDKLRTVQINRAETSKTVLRCDCLSFVFSKAPKTCKHVTKAHEMLLAGTLVVDAPGYRKRADEGPWLAQARDLARSISTAFARAGQSEMAILLNMHTEISVRVYLDWMKSFVPPAGTESASSVDSGFGVRKIVFDE